MTAARRKGTEFESAIVAEFRAADMLAYRVAQAGSLDSGDIAVPHSGLVLQAKNYADVATALRLGLDGAVRQAGVAGVPFGAAVLKRRGKGAAEAAVVMRLSDFIRLLGGYCE